MRDLSLPFERVLTSRELYEDEQIDVRSTELESVGSLPDGLILTFSRSSKARLSEQRSILISLSSNDPPSLPSARVSLYWTAKHNMSGPYYNGGGGGGYGGYDNRAPRGRGGGGYRGGGRRGKHRSPYLYPVILA